MRHFKNINLIICLAVLCLLASGTLLNAKEKRDQKTDNRRIKLMSYNLKFACPKFKPAWKVRREWQVDMINKYSPDIIGTQEGLKEQIDYLQDKLPEYVVIGEGRKGGDDDEHMAIFFKRDRFRLREMSTFQLSETPEVPGSGPGKNPRIVTWARLAIINRPAKGDPSPYPTDYREHWKNTQEFYVFNTHFFTRNRDLAKLNSAKLILERINELNRFGEWTKERPVFLMGDFNARPRGEVYKTFIGDKNSKGDHLLMKDSVKGGRGIDWILYKGNVKVLHYEKVNYKVNDVYPSDHKPIFVEIQILDK